MKEQQIQQQYLHSGSEKVRLNPFEKLSEKDKKWV